MASGYKLNNVDLDDLVEPYCFASAVNSNNETLSSFNSNGTTINNRYQKANTDVWAKLLTLPLSMNNNAVIGVQKGCLPTATKFAELTSVGTYSISRSESGLTIGSTTYPASTFRNNYVPRVIGVVCCGGGGGAGGQGKDEGDKNGYNVMNGGGGGGGQIFVGLIHIYNTTASITIGAGGAGGSNGSSQPSSGGTGGKGSNSSISIAQSNYNISLSGGNGGNGGVGDTTYGEGGTSIAGYSGGDLTNNGAVSCVAISSGRGGKISSYGGDGTTLTNFSFTKGAGDPANATLFNNAASGQVLSSGNSYRDSWAGGGASIGNGADINNSATKGGGGCSGNGNANGANGYCAFYY